MKKQEIGQILSFVRSKTKIQSKHLCYGLCDVRTLRRIENGNSKGNKCLIEALFSRMGKTTVHFEYYISLDEYRQQDMCFKIKQAAISNDKERLNKLLPIYQKQTGTLGALQKQFVLSIKAFLCEGKDREKKKRELLEQALNCTVPNFVEKKLEKTYLSTEEVYIISRLANAYEEEGNTIRAYNLRNFCYNYLWQDRIDEEMRLINLPPLSLQLVKQLYNQKEYSILIKISTRMIEFLTNNRELFTLSEMIEYRVRAMQEKDYSNEEVSFYKSELLYASILSTLMKENRQTKTTGGETIPMDEIGMTLILRNQSECHLIGEDIRFRRKVQKMKQSELCDGICSMKALSAIENGKSTPREVIYIALMERLGATDFFSGKYVDVSNFSMDGKRFQIERNIGKRNFKEAKVVFGELKKELTEEKADLQYRILIQTILDVRLYQLKPERALERYEEALSYSLPDRENKLLDWCLRKNEVKLQNCIALMEKQMGYIKESIHRLSEIRSYFENSQIDVCCHLHQYELILRNLGSLSGLEKCHEEAVKIADKLIQLSVCWGDGEFLSAALYMKAWNIEKTEEEKEESKEMDACQKYIKQAYVIATVMGNLTAAEHYARHYKEKYGEVLNLTSLGNSPAS